MLLTAALLPLLVPCAAPAALRQEPSGTEGLAWFEGSLDEALAAAAGSEGLVMVELRTDWETACGRLERVLEDGAVVAELADTVCLQVDAEGPDGALLAYRQGVALYPTLLFLEPDGQLRDRLQGVFSGPELVAELRRIDRGERTIKSMRDAVAAAPDDLELRYALSRRLEAAGDTTAAAAEQAEIRRRDPEGTSLASRRMGFDVIHADVYDALLAWQEPDWEALRQATEAADDPLLEFKGLALLAYANHIEGVRARNMKKPDEVQPHLKASRDYYRQAYEVCPPASVSAFGNEVAWKHYEDRANLTDEERAFALEVATSAHELDPRNASILDTLACCYFMNGDVERALELNERCRELDPSRPEQWAANEALFTGAAEPDARPEDEAHPAEDGPAPEDEQEPREGSGSGGE